MKRILRTLLLALGLLVGGLVLLVAVTVAALPTIAEHLPLELSRVLISDGRRQVEMQGMAHLARPAFYREVAAHVAERRREGWLVFYEEVRPDNGPSAPGVADVMKRLGANWNPDSKQHPYEMLSGLVGNGLVLQDNPSLLGPPGPDLRNVDITLSQLLAALPPARDSGEDEPATLDLAQAKDSFATLPGWVQRRVQAAIRITLAVTAAGSFAHDSLPPALTTLREELVAKAIETEPDRNILVLYGQVHIGPIRNRLANRDERWHTLSTTALRAF